MKRTLSVVSVVPLAIALLLAMGGATTASAATATTTSSTSSTVKARAPHQQDYPDFSCEYRYNKNESDDQYRCSYRYYYHHRWHQYRWWDADYNPPNWS